MIFWSCSSKAREIQLDENFDGICRFSLLQKPLWNPNVFFLYRSCSLVVRRRNREPRDKLGFPTTPVTLGWLLVRGNETDRWQCLSGNIRCFFVRLLGWSNARKKITQGPPLMQWVKYCDSPNILTLWIVHIYAIYFPVCLSLVCWWGNGRWLGLGYPAHMTCSQAEFSHSTHANVLSNILNIVDTRISVHLQSQAGCFKRHSDSWNFQPHKLRRLVKTSLEKKLLICKRLAWPTSLLCSTKDFCAVTIWNEITWFTWVDMLHLQLDTTYLKRNT